MNAPQPATRIVDALSVDVEDYFQVSAFEGHVRREDWVRHPPRVEANTERLLALFADCGVHATFFCLGWVGLRHPALLRRIVEGGHELASHGWDHTRVNQMDRAALREDVRRTKQVLEDATGVAVRGYRAPTFSIGERNLWALGVLAEEGHLYSSSIFPVRHDLYGYPDAPRFAFRDPESGLLEVPLSTLRLAGRNLPFLGGGWFRLLPYAVTRGAVRRFHAHEGQPCIFYMHPWEVDPGQPRPADLPWRSRFRHYVNLHRVEGRLRRLLRDFHWDRMDRVFLGDEAGVPGAGRR